MYIAKTEHTFVRKYQIVIKVIVTIDDQSYLSRLCSPAMSGIVCDTHVKYSPLANVRLMVHLDTWDDPRLAHPSAICCAHQFG